MKALRFLSIMIAAALFFSCEKDTPEKEQMVEVEIEFGIDHVLPAGTKDLPAEPVEPPACPEDLEPYRAVVHIEEEVNGTWTPVPGSPFKPLVFYVDGVLHSQSIKFMANADETPKQLKVTSFHIENEDLIPIMATPLIGAPYSEFVTKPISFNFSVEPFEKSAVYVEVLCFVPEDYENFGFNWFEIGQFIIREYNFFGNFCLKDAAMYQGENNDEYPTHVYKNIPGFPESGYVDAPAIFKIEVFDKDAPEGEVPNQEFYYDGIGPDPLKIEAKMIPGEEYRFELSLLVADGAGGLYYAHIYTFYAEATYNNATEPVFAPLTNEDGTNEYAYDHGVFHFVVGGCIYGGNLDLQLPPWQVLPTTANVTIQHENWGTNAGAYWKLTVNSLNPNGTYDFPGANEVVAGWCGDHTVEIPDGERDFFIYSSYWDYNWPTMPEIVTLDKLASVNWLMNNLDLPSYGITMPTSMFIDYDFFDTQDAKDIQDAIWLIINGTVHTGTPSARAAEMAEDAENFIDFVPLPGGYAAVLLVEGPDATKYQLIFTVVDP